MDERQGLHYLVLRINISPSSGHRIKQVQLTVETYLVQLSAAILSKRSNDATNV